MSATPEPLDAAELEAELAIVLRAQYARVQGGQRNTVANIAFVLMVALVCGLTLLPPLQEFFRVTFTEIAVLMGIETMVFVACAVVYQKLGGDSEAFRRIERCEVVVVIVVALALVYLSGGAGSVFWAFYYLQMLTLIPMPLNLRFNLAALLGATLALALAFAVGGQLADALASLFLGGASVWVLATLGKGQLDQARTLAERNLLERQLQSLRVEHERERIARDLHDGIGAELTSLVVQARALRASPTGVQHERLDELVDRARRNLDELRTIVFGLKHPSPQWPELIVQMRRKVRDLCGDAVTCEVHDELEDAPPLPDDWPRQLLPAVQEAVRNAVRHAKASGVIVRLSGRDRLRLEISDDGQGLPAAAIESSVGGLANLDQRIRSLQGTLTIGSGPGGTGTRLVAEIPWPAELAS